MRNEVGKNKVLVCAHSHCETLQVMCDLHIYMGDELGAKSVLEMHRFGFASF